MTALVAVAVLACGLGGCHRGGIDAMSAKERENLKAAEAAGAQRARQNSIPLKYRRQADSVAMTQIIRKKLGARTAPIAGTAQIYRNGTIPGAYRNQNAYANNDAASIRARGLAPGSMTMLGRMHPTTFHGHLVTTGPDGAPIVH